MQRITFSTTLELLKPVTWFAPMWALGCGVVSSGMPVAENWLIVIGGILLAGPLVCGTSQAVNDWFDRHVDAINEPDRPIPSGRMPGRSGFYVACLWTLLSLLVAALLGWLVLAAAAVGLVLAWLYSIPPIRLKNNGWLGNLACAICYEGLPWFTGVAMLTAVLPPDEVLWLALLYSLGAHGIMTLNDFKAVEGDRQMGIRSLPVQLGERRAALALCATMIVAQVVVSVLLYRWGHPYHGGTIALLIVGQLALMPRLLADPVKRAPWFNGTGILLYVIGMLVSAFAVRPESVI